jgi:uncharacterized phage protein (TIGR01671 family)
MREIKFRAWDETMGRYYEPLHEAYNNRLFELMVGFSGDLVAHTMNGVEHQSTFTNKYVLEQFTGLLDKNGKEIYEGDILGMDASGLGEWPVVFEGGQFEAGGISLINAIDFGYFVVGNIREGVGP